MLVAVTEIPATGDAREVLVNPNGVAYVAPLPQGRRCKAYIKLMGSDDKIGVDKSVKEIIASFQLDVVLLSYFDSFERPSFDNALYGVVCENIRNVKPFGSCFEVCFKDGSSLPVRNVDLLSGK